MRLACLLASVHLALARRSDAPQDSVASVEGARDSVSPAGDPRESVSSAGSWDPRASMRINTRLGAARRPRGSVASLDVLASVPVSASFEGSAANRSRDSGTNVSANAFPGLYVFVRKAPIRLAVLGNLFGGFHTEVVYCTSNKDVLEVDGLLATASIEDAEKQPNRGWFGETFESCWVNGFPGVQALPSEDVKAKVMLEFYEPADTKGIETHYVGRTEVIGGDEWGIKAFIAEMQRCGNWEISDYNVFRNNCNAWQDACMKALFPERDAEGKMRKHRLFGRHRLEKDTVRDNGWYDPVSGTCLGAKCYTPCFNRDPGRALEVHGSCVDGTCLRAGTEMGGPCTPLTNKKHHRDLFRTCQKESGVCYDGSPFQQKGNHYGCHLL